MQLSAGLVSYAADEPAGWETMLETARLYDRVGVDRLVVSDHVVFGEQLDAYERPELGGARGGRQPTGPDGHWLEPLTALSVIAGSTARVRLSTGILLAALRRPVVLAKAAATLDVLSGGRLDLGVGVGWQREEYEAAGLDFAQRGRLLDHTLEVCTALWTERVARYQSPELAFDRIHMMPKPVQPGGVPIWISGTVNARVVDRPFVLPALVAQDSVDQRRPAERPLPGIQRVGGSGRGWHRAVAQHEPAVGQLDTGEIDLEQTMAAVRPHRGRRDRPTRALPGTRPTTRPKHACATS